MNAVTVLKNAGFCDSPLNSCPLTPPQIQYSKTFWMMMKLMLSYDRWLNWFHFISPLFPLAELIFFFLMPS